jgi:hypothetical protein
MQILRKGAINMKVIAFRRQNEFVVDLWREDLHRSVTLTVREGEDGNIELELVVNDAIIVVGEEDIVVKSKFGDEISVRLSD